MVQLKVVKRGSRLLVDLPAAIAEAAGLKEGSTVRLLAGKNGVRLVAQKPRYTLAGLVKGITPQNRHDEIDWGPAVGKEIIE